MSSHGNDFAAILCHFLLSYDGAVLGIALAYSAVRTLFKLRSTSHALRKLETAPQVRVCDLRALLQDDGKKSHMSDHEQNSGRLVVVRGHVEAKSAVEGKNWKNWTNGAGVLVSNYSGDKAVIIQRTQTWLYNEWRGFFGLTPDIHAIFGRSWRKKESSLRMVPFVLVEGGWWPQSDYVNVDMDGSKHPLPFIRVYHDLQPFNVSPFALLQAIFGHECPVGVLDEEKILPLGENISAIGICSLKNGIPEICSCKDLPYFLTEMTKCQMVADLACKSQVLFWSSIVLGSLSVGILGYAISRNWNRWKECRELRRSQQTTQGQRDDANSQLGGDDEAVGDIPDGQLCVICLVRRRTSVFGPCGHVVCCHRCAISVEREISPKCPICRMPVRSSMRIFFS